MAGVLSDAGSRVDGEAEMEGDEVGRRGVRDCVVRSGRRTGPGPKQTNPVKKGYLHVSG